MWSWAVVGAYGHGVSARVDDEKIHRLTARGLAAAVASGDLTASEVLAHTTERAERLGPVVGAFARLGPELAEREAAAVDAAIAAGGGPAMPLLGVPCPIKDLTMVAGRPMEAGSAAFAGFTAPHDDGVVLRLRAAGTINIGSTATPEFGLPCYTEPDVGVPARTPWDLARGAGGSSGGAAAAVAAGIVPIAHASDGGGSIRIPAASCGLVGLKASRGVVSTGPHGVDGPGLATSGVLSRDVRDTALVLDVLARGWPGDVGAPRTPVTGYLAACDQPLGGPVRIGVLTTPANSVAPVHPEALAAVERAVTALTALGHSLSPAPVPFTPAEWEAFLPVWATMALSAPVPAEREHLLVPLTRWLRELGRSVSGTQYAAAITGMQQLTRQVASRWAEFDVVLTPTLAQPPAPVGSLRDDDDPAADFEAQKRFTPWTSLANITGAPSISLPLHRARVEGLELPFSVMLTGRWGADDVLLALAAQLEAADPWPAPLEIGS